MGAAMATKRHVSWDLLIRHGPSLATLLLGAAIAGLFTYLATAQANVELLRQQQRTVIIQQFEESGARMDSNLSLFVDTLIDRDKADEARKEARIAITLHASQARGLNDIVGKKNVDGYLKGLGQLRQFVDQTQDVPTAMRAAQSHVFLMEYRDKLVMRARQET